MNKWQKIGLAVGFTTATLTATHIINKLIFSNAISKGLTDTDSRLNYKWKFGDISYTKCGEGSPILLIHDLTATSSTYEWKRVISTLANKHTVYTIDLLGCGYSDKPNITYTAYMYVQMLNDFITNVIGKKTDIIATGTSAPIAIMACYSNSTLYNKIVMINPESIGRAMQNPSKKANLLKLLLNAPIIGTSIYNMCMSKMSIQNTFDNDLFYNSSELPEAVLDSYYETAHLCGPCSKFLFTSTECRYTTVTISKALNSLDNSIYIIGGSDEYMIDEIINDYTRINPSIESVIINECKHLPQIEKPHELIEQLNIFL